MESSTQPVSESAPATPVAPAGLPAPAPPKRLAPGIVLTAALTALGVAIATSVFATHQIGDLRRELAALQDAHQQLAGQVVGRKGTTGPIGETIDVAGAPALGRGDAVVTLIEFSDYECPFCIRHFQQTWPQIDEHYVKSGKIRYVFRDFPIDSNHPQAIRAHEAAHCALEQNRFWDLHGRLFSAPGTHTPIALEDRAREAGLNDAAFRACIAGGRATKDVRAIGTIAETLGATGTPWFFLGIRDLRSDKVRVLRPIGGAQPYAQFVAAIDAVLKDAGGP